MLKYIPVIGLALVLAACESLGPAVGSATEKIKGAKDVEARVLIDSTCAMGVGAWTRLDNPDEQEGVMMICGGSGTTVRVTTVGNAPTINVEIPDN